MADGVDIDGGGIDMFLSGADALMNTLGEHGSTFRTAWLAMLGEIASFDTKLGNGPMGRELAAQYNPAVKQIVDGLDELGRRVETRVSFGHQNVANYTAADEAAHQSISGV